MRVRLLAYTQLNPDETTLPEPFAAGQGTPQENLIEYAGRICYRSLARMGHSDTFITARVQEGHEDIIEHISVTFLVEGISRTCSHQLVRHRLASYSQESQRYVSLDKGGWKPILPPDIADNEEAAAILAEAWEDLQAAYGKLRQLGIKKEDARFLLPNATETRLVLSMNLRSLRHFFHLRCDVAAQWEIRNMAREMLRLVYPLAPNVFQDIYDACFTRETS